MKIDVSQDVREFAKAQGIEVGERGKIALSTKVAFLSENPEVVRLLAETNGVEIPSRGKLSAESIEAVGRRLN